jgi:adenosylhomocysteine nucleosidase
MVIGVTGLAFEARIAAYWCTHAICSGDGRTLPESLTSAIAGDCCGLISFGVAGGLSPDLPTGTYIVASTIVSETIELATDRDWSQALVQLIPGAIHGAIAGAANIVAHPEAKRTLHMSTGALAVDNESHVVASAAAAHRLPMATVRVIMDPAARQLPAAARGDSDHRDVDCCSGQRGTDGRSRPFAGGRRLPSAAAGGQDRWRLEGSLI